MVNYRHGDIALIGVKEIPTGLKISKSKTIHKGKTQEHKFDNGKFYLNDGEIVIGYFIAKNTTLLHPDHGKGNKGDKKAKIKDGVYEVRVQQEITHKEMRRVED